MLIRRDRARKLTSTSRPYRHSQHYPPLEDQLTPESVVQPDTTGESYKRPRSGDFSRRELLKRAGTVGMFTTLTLSVFVPARASQSPQEPFETLTAAESDTLEAVVARLIPTDDMGLGATEARAAHYIDRALTGPLSSSRGAYSSGLDALNRYATLSRNGSFMELSASDQDAVLRDMELNVATGFTPDSSTFFNLLRTHTIEGTFCDPYYGGNAHFVGWDLIGYPGVRTVVTVDQQRMNVSPVPNRRSAYDYTMFTKGGS